MTRFIEQRLERVEKAVANHLRHHGRAEHEKEEEEGKEPDENNRPDHKENGDHDGDNSRCCEQVRERLEGLVHNVADIRDQNHTIIVLLQGIIDRHKLVSLRIGAFAEEPRDAPGQGGQLVPIQIRSTTQAAALISGTDADGASASVAGVTVDNSAATGVTGSLRDNPSGGLDIVVADNSGANLGPAGSVTLNPPPGSAAVPVTLDFEIVPTDATIISVSAFTEEPRL